MAFYIKKINFSTYNIKNGKCTSSTISIQKISTNDHLDINCILRQSDMTIAYGVLYQFNHIKKYLIILYNTKWDMLKKHYIMNLNSTQYQAMM